MRTKGTQASVGYRETTSTLETVPHEKLGEGKGVTPSVVTNGVNDAHQAVLELTQHRHASAHTLHFHGKMGRYYYSRLPKLALPKRVSAISIKHLMRQFSYLQDANSFKI